MTHPNKSLNDNGSWSTGDGGFDNRITLTIRERDALRARLAEVERELATARDAHLVMTRRLLKAEPTDEDARDLGVQFHRPLPVYGCAQEQPTWRMVAETLKRARDAEKQRADRAEALCEQMGLELADRYDAKAAVAQLRAALENQAGDTPGPNSRPCWCNEDDCRCRDRAWCVESRAALASTDLGRGWVSPEKVRGLMEQAWYSGFQHEPEGDERHACRRELDALLAEVTK